MSLTLPHQQPPPKYTPSPSATTSSEPKIANFICFNNYRTPIEGKYMIDADMTIPSALLNPLGEGQTEEERKNVFFKTGEGKIDVDLAIMNHPRTCSTNSTSARSMDHRKHITIAMTSLSGIIWTKIVRLLFPVNHPS